MRTNPQNAFNNIVYIGEVTLHFPSIVHIYGQAEPRAIRKYIISHIWAPPGAIHREESQPGLAHAIKI